MLWIGAILISSVLLAQEAPVQQILEPQPIIGVDDNKNPGGGGVIDVDAPSPIAPQVFDGFNGAVQETFAAPFAEQKAMLAEKAKLDAQRKIAEENKDKVESKAAASAAKPSLGVSSASAKPSVGKGKASANAKNPAKVLKPAVQAKTANKSSRLPATKTKQKPSSVKKTARPPASAKPVAKDKKSVKLKPLKKK